MRASPSLSILVVAIAIALLASACGAAGPGPTTGPSSVPSAALAAQPTATVAPTPLTAPSSPTPAPSASPSSTPTPGPTSGPSATPTPAGQQAVQVVGTGSYPGYTVVLPAGWTHNQYFALGEGARTGPPRGALGIGVWDVGQVFRDPCHWQGQGFDPGPSVGELVAALVAQPMRNATRPTDVTLAGYPGKYLEWSVPATIKSSAPSEFDACDVEPDGQHHDFQGWLGNGMGNRYEQVPGQVDRLWVLDVNGQRLVVDATYSPDTTPADRAELASVVASLRFDAP